MSEFKYACPVCGQHIVCDSSKAGTVMECPTCFQKITVPQAPKSDNAKFIITGTKVGERPPPTVHGMTSMGSRLQGKGFSGAVVVVLILILIGAVVGFIYRGTIFKSAETLMSPTNSSQTAQTSSTSFPWPVVMVPTNLPVPAATNYWTLNVKAVGTPNVPVEGKVHGRYFRAAAMILNQDGLTIRTATYPPEAGITVYLRPNPIESLYGKSLLFETNTPNAAPVYLRWRNEQGTESDQVENTGYALRIEFGRPVSNSIPGKIYLCTTDEFKSYVVGNFNAQIVQPQPQPQ